MDGVEITQLAGLCPVEGEGTIDGKPFYFRSRGSKWSIGIGEDPMFATEWSAGGAWGVDFEAGYMPADIAQAIIEKAAELYRVSRWDDAARARLAADISGEVQTQVVDKAD